MKLCSFFLIVICLIPAFSNAEPRSSAELPCNELKYVELPLLETEFEKINELDRQKNQLLSDEEFILQGKDQRYLKYQQVYNDCLEPLLAKHSDLNNLSMEQLSDLFEAISHTQFYTNSSQQSLVMKSLLKTLETKEAIAQGTLVEMATTMSRAFIRSRQFGELNALASKYENLPNPEVYFDESGTKEGVSPKKSSQMRMPFNKESTSDGVNRQIMTQLGSETAFYIKPFKLTGKAQIVIVSNPYCGYSQKAREFLSQHEHYRSTFAEYATWLIPPDGNLYFDAVNEDPQQELFPFVYTYKSSEWHEIDYWGTPAFYFYKDGELKYKVIGWGEGREVYIKKGLEKIGLN